MPVTSAPNPYEELLADVRRGNLPWGGSIELTYRCNERCAMCYLGPDWGAGRKGDELTTQEVFDLLDQLAAAGCFGLLLTGGEITLRKDVIEIVDYAGSKGFSLAIKTNGTRVTPEFVAAMQRNPVEVVEISLLGSTATTHDKVARIPGSLQKTLAGITMLREAGVQVKLYYTAVTLNFHELHEARKLAMQLGCDFEWYSEISPRDDRATIPLTLRLNTEDQAAAQALRVRERIEENGGWEASDYKDEGWFCAAGKTSFNITPYGEVQPCIAMRMDCGNVREQPFLDIWQHAAPFVRLRTLRIAEVFGCSSCPVRDYCDACPGLFYMEMGDVTVPSPHTCEMAEMRHKAATGEYKPAGSRDEKGQFPRPVNVVVGSIHEPLLLKRGRLNA